MTTEIATGDGLYDVPELPSAPDHDVPADGSADDLAYGPAYGPPVEIEDPFPESADPREPDAVTGPPTGPDGGRVQRRFSAPLPVGSRLTSGFGTREGILHAGTDWGPPTPGQRGVSVVAVADATVLAVGRNRGRRADRIPYHSGRFVWLDLGVLGGQRMRVYYGHLASVGVTEGQRLQAGQVVGVMGGSGASGEDDFPVHLHFGVAQDHDRPVLAARRHGAAGWINADAWLRSKGIRVGTTAPVVVEAAPSDTTTQQAEEQAVQQTANSAGPRHVRDEASIRRICIRAGHGDSTTTLGLLIERYQHRQQEPLTLEHDRHWGAVTERHYQWVLTLQRALNAWKGADLTVDGDYGRKTAARVREVQARNLAGAYRKAGGTVADGKPGAAMARMLGIAPYPG